MSKRSQPKRLRDDDSEECGDVAEEKRCQVKVPRSIDQFLMSFLRLFEDKTIETFLCMDSCNIIADRYLLAMVYVYFRRAGLVVEQYSKCNFFAALHLANDIEEDDANYKHKIFQCALGSGYTQQRDILWNRMNFRAIVSRKVCEEVISLSPDHRIWQRHRLPHHAEALMKLARAHETHD